MTDAAPLVDHSLDAFAERLATSAPVPGGGSAAALTGATAAALVGMVAALSQGPRSDRAPVAREIELGATVLRRELLELVDRDAAAYTGVVTARRMPRDTAQERDRRQQELARALTDATAVPLHTAERIAEVLELCERLVPIANRNAISDLGVAARLAAAGLHGALLNVAVNLPHLAEADPLRPAAQGALARLAARADVSSASVLRDVEEHMAQLAEAAR